MARRRSSRRGAPGGSRRSSGVRLEDPKTLFDQEPAAGAFFPPGQAEDFRAPEPGERAGAVTARRRGRRARFETLARTLVAVPWIVFAVLIIAAGGVPFMVAMVGLASLGLFEFFRITASARPFVPVGFAVASAAIVAAHYSSGRTAVLIAGLAFPLMFVFAAGRPSREGITASFAITLLGIAWIGAPFAHAVLLRDLPLHGGALLVDVLVATFLADTAAYVGGRLFGRHRLAPSLSPNKTVEGLLAGFVGGTIGFWFAGLYQDWLSGVDALLMGACIAAVAPIGDLFESMIKRDLDVKDTGRAFGPHGGLLDRLDAVLFTVVAGFYLSHALVY
jgi:phosphatidate cytidylyltransferase